MMFVADANSAQYEAILASCNDDDDNGNIISTDDNGNGDDGAVNTFTLFPTPTPVDDVNFDYYYNDDDNDDGYYSLCNTYYQTASICSMSAAACFLGSVINMVLLRMLGAPELCWR